MRTGIFVVLLCACSGSGSSTSDGPPGGGGGGGGGSGTHKDAAMADVPGGTGEPTDLTGITMDHNVVRAMVDTTGIAAGPLPPLAWDPNLASYAAAWAAMCQSTGGQLLDHDPNRTNVAGYAYIGENIYASSGTATAQGAVDAWAAEKQYFTYPDTCATGQVCGHYTQVVWRDTTHVGCALQNCPALQFPSNIVCDYGPGGNYEGQAPY
ncbi:MAG TPA: CAP domain-containing protein [Kofleriaceae bacterium]|nr:CAP domain-containing protein [Kofleriaceae bacterium]